MVQLEQSRLRNLADSMYSLLLLPSRKHMNSDPVEKYYRKAEGILELMKPVLEAYFECEVECSEILIEKFKELTQYLNELKVLFESWKSLSSRIYHVLRIELLILRIHESCSAILKQLRSAKEILPSKLSSFTLKEATKKIKHFGLEQISSVIEEAIGNQNENFALDPDVLEEIAENLGLKSSEEILIEAVALDKLKEKADQAERRSEVKFLNNLISIINRMHDRLIEIKQSQRCSHVPIPLDLCCPLSLELMTDPVIVASGQTYERAFIRRWIDRGLTVCPKTRQSLVRTSLTPNYTVKDLIAKWCEQNGVEPSAPWKSVNFDSDNSLHPQITRSRSDPPMLQEPLQLMGSNRTPVFTDFEKRGAATSHPRSTSESALCGILQNVRDLDFVRISKNDSREMSDSQEISDFEGEKADAFAAVASPSRNESLRCSPECQNEMSGDYSRATFSSSFQPSADGSVETKASASLAAIDHKPSESSQMPVSIHTLNQELWLRSSVKSLIPRVVPATASQSRSEDSEIAVQVRRLVQNLRSPLADIKREATSELRELARKDAENRIAIASSGAISLLIDLLYSAESQTQEYAVTAILNLSISDNNKILIGKENAIEPLIFVLETGSPVAKENAAATLFSLSVTEENKKKIGQSRAIGALVDLLGNGTLNGKKDATTALFNLSLHHENKARIVEAGAVKQLVELMDPAAGMADKVVGVLANLATIPEGRTEIGREGAVRMLVEVVELGSARGKESTAAALCHLCMNSNRFCKEVLQEGAVPPLMALSHSGTPRGREKANSLLRHFRRNQPYGNIGRR